MSVIFRKALILAIVLEAVAFIVGVGEIYIGGTEEFGGYIFSLVHIPSSLLLAYLFQLVGFEGRVTDIVFVLLVTIFQIALLTSIVYEVMRLNIYVRRKKG